MRKHVVVYESATHPHSSSPGLTGRPSIPETAMIEPRSRSVLDTPLSRGTTAFLGATLSLLLVITRSEATKQSILPFCGAMDCFASLAMTGINYSSQTSQTPRRNPDASATAPGGFRRYRPPPTACAVRRVAAARRCPGTGYRNLRHRYA